MKNASVKEILFFFLMILIAVLLSVAASTMVRAESIFEKGTFQLGEVVIHTSPSTHEFVVCTYNFWGCTTMVARSYSLEVDKSMKTVTLYSEENGTKEIVTDNSISIQLVKKGSLDSCCYD